MKTLHLDRFFLKTWTILFALTVQLISPSFAGVQPLGRTPDVKPIQLEILTEKLKKEIQTSQLALEKILQDIEEARDREFSDTLRTLPILFQKRKTLKKQIRENEEIVTWIEELTKEKVLTAGALQTTILRIQREAAQLEFESLERRKQSGTETIQNLYRIVVLKKKAAYFREILKDTAPSLLLQLEAGLG